MQKEITVVRHTACRRVYLVLDFNHKTVLKFLVFLSNSSPYLLVFVLEPPLLYFLYCSVVQLVWIFYAMEDKLQQHLDLLYAFYDCSILCEKGFLTFQHIVSCRGDILISKQHSYFSKKPCDIYYIFLLFGCLQFGHGWRVQSM